MHNTCRYVLNWQPDIIIYYSESITLVLFWIVLDDEVQDPTIILPITTTEVVHAINVDLSATIGVDKNLTDVDMSAKVFNLQKAHSIFVESQVFIEDLVNFQRSLTEYFSSGIYDCGSNTIKSRGLVVIDEAWNPRVNVNIPYPMLQN